MKENSLIVGMQYKITVPNYDELDEQDIDWVEVVSKDTNRGAYILNYLGLYKDSKLVKWEDMGEGSKPFTLRKSYSDLQNSIIESL